VTEEKFYYLPKFDGDWLNLNNKIKEPRYFYTAFWVPDAVTNCKEKGN